MSMQPSAQLRQALEKGLERLNTQHTELNRFHRPGFSEWAMGGVVITSDELEGIIKSSQLFDNEIEVLAQATEMIRFVLTPIRSLAIAVDPSWPERPMIVAAPNIFGH